MTIFFVLFTLVFALGSLGMPKAWALEDKRFLSREKTSAINGYFISLVFLSHLRSYIDSANYTALDQGWRVVISYLGQLVVATFLFFSGYGIMESIKHKGDDYVRKLPTRRILPFLLDVWIALASFLVVRLLLGKRMPKPFTLLLAMVGWKSIGNSNWYIFAILCLWVCTYVAFRLFPKPDQRWMGVATTAALVVGYCLTMKYGGIPKYFYDTALCYPAGLAFSLVMDTVRPWFDGLELRSRHLVWIATMTALIAVFATLYYRAWSRAVLFNMLAVVFALLWAIGSAPVTHVSKPFVWAGQNLFYLYIYQRIPMMILQPLLATNTFAYTTACFVTLIPYCMMMSKMHASAKRAILG